MGGIVYQIKAFRNTAPDKKLMYEYLLPFIKEKNYRFNSNVVHFLGGCIIPNRELKKMKEQYVENLYLMDDQYKEKIYADSFAFFSEKELVIDEDMRDNISGDLVNFVDEAQLHYFLNKGDSTVQSKALKRLVDKYREEKRELPSDLAVSAIIEGLGQMKGFSVVDLILEQGRMDVYLELIKRGRLDSPRYKLFEDLFHKMYAKPTNPKSIQGIFSRLPRGAVEMMAGFTNFNHKRILNMQPELFVYMLKYPEIKAALAFNKSELSAEGVNVEANISELFKQDPLFFSKKELYNFLNKPSLSSSLKELLEVSLKKQL